MIVPVAGKTPFQELAEHSAAQQQRIEELEAEHRDALLEAQALDYKLTAERELSRKLYEALKESAEFVDGHSEPWYTRGQLLVNKCDEAVAAYEGARK